MSTAGLCEIGPGRFAHASGAMWISATRIMFIADVHLGYAWALRRRGQLGPVTEGGLGERLAEAVIALRPATVVLLGDVVHASKPAHAERRVVESTLHTLIALSRVVVVRGNHDRAFARDYAGLDVEIADHWEDSEIVAVHGDRAFGDTDKHILIGHVHPAVGVVDHAGACQRVPAFLVSDRVTVLPAFSPFAAGVDVRAGLPAPLDTIFRDVDVMVYAATGKRVVRVGSLQRLLHTK